MSIAGERKPIRVFVHLAANFDARRWEEGWQAGRIIGINERLPYGYFRAADDGCVITYSAAKPANWLEKTAGSAITKLTRIDFLHAWHNRKGLFDCDVVWTHTEFQYLAVLLLFQLFFWKRRPKLIAQTVWLFDRWNGFNLIQRRILSFLIAKADILTFLSPENLKAARRVFPRVRSEFVPFGINTAELGSLKRQKPHCPVRVLAIGNDPHRDWDVLIEAAKNMPDCHVKIASWTIDKAKIAPFSNIEVLTISSNSQLIEAFDWADLLALTLKPNLHASGITVMEEAAVRGLPIICTDTGGLRAYFSDREAYYVPPGDPAAVQAAIVRLAGDDALRWGLAACAQEKMKSGELSSRAYARRHAEISRELLKRTAAPSMARPCKPAA
ncbi:MAG TPA: glycosyltransferase family 4 protein [Methylocella sp.]|nr:glycosyltransferase family 4 protein [Methylocella sp.]